MLPSMFIRDSISWPDFGEVDFVPSPPTLPSDRSASQTTSNDGSKLRTSSNAVLQDIASRDDLPAIPSDLSEDEDDSSDQLQKRNLFQSLQHNPSPLSPNSSSLSIKSAVLNRAQYDSSKLDTKTKPENSISLNDSGVPSTYSESFLYNPFMAITPPGPNHDKFAKTSLLRRKNAMKPKATYHVTTNDLGQPVISPKSPANLPSSSKTKKGNGVSSTPQVKEMLEFLSISTPDTVEVVVYPLEPFSSSPVSHHGYDVPVINTQTSQSHNYSAIRSDCNNIDNQKYFSEMNNRGDFTSDKPPTSPNVRGPPLHSATISPRGNSSVGKVEARRKPNMITFLLKLVTPQASTQVPEKPKTQQWRPPLRPLLRIDSLPSDDFTSAPDDSLARKMEELGHLRRMESRDQLVQSRTSSESRTTYTSKAEILPQLQTLQEDNSSDAARLLREAYVERQQALQTQLDKALAELRDVQAENKRLTSENQSQQRSISHLKIALDEAKHEHENSLIRINNQLCDATSSLTLLNKEKKGWQDRLDSMQHKVNATERQVRCLDHLTRHKLESRQEAGHSQPKRRGGQFASTIPASTDVINAICALNEEIHQACVQLVEGLERTAVFSTKQKPQVQNVLGEHLTAMMVDQAKKVTTGYNKLLMQTVLEVFMIHWCSSIIEAFYPQQESFADLMVLLSGQTTGLTAVCGKQNKIIQPSTTTHRDSVKFNEWVKDIISELGLFLTMAGLRMKTQCSTLFSMKTLTLVEGAYDLRTAMAEKDICGGLEIVIVPPGTPFEEKWMMMDDPTRKVDISMDESKVDFVAGTTGVGLQRKVLEMVDGGGEFQCRMELKPKVVLARTLL